MRSFQSMDELTSLVGQEIVLMAWIMSTLEQIKQALCASANNSLAKQLGLQAKLQMCAAYISNFRGGASAFLEKRQTLTTGR
jgi:hypothetical protein